MNLVALVRRNLFYHWRGNLAVLLGIALGSAVLTGALLVGDSLRGSLRDLTLGQLGWVLSVLAPSRLFTEGLAAKLPSERHAGIVLLNGSAAPADAPERASPLQLLGVKADFWQKSEDAEFWDGQLAEVVLNQALARALDVKVGDSIWLTVQKADDVPRESLLGKRKSDDVLEPLSLKVRGVPTDDPMANFALRPSPEATLNAFVPLAYLQKRLKLDGKINIALFAGVDKTPRNEVGDLQSDLTLRDWGLKLLTPDDRARSLVRFLDPTNRTGELRRLKWQGRVPETLARRADAGGVLTQKSIDEFYNENRRYIVLQSDRLFLDHNVEAALQKVFPNFDDDKSLRPTLIYLADSLEVDGKPGAAGKNDVPYATVAAVRSDQVPGFAKLNLQPREIVLVDWPGSPPLAKVGDEISAWFYIPAEQNKLAHVEHSFKLRGIVPLEGDVDDPDWTPEFPGLTDKLDIGSWENPPFPPYSTKKLMERITPADEDFWKRYRATPRAYISLEDGQRLFGTRFGNLTALRIDVPADRDPNEVARDLATKLLKELKPERGGFVVQNLREQAERASGGSNDFGVLFLSFSFFLILSALVLVGLLVRLNLERRSPEIGLLAATGWGPRTIGRILALESVTLIVGGAAAGLVGARWFASGMLKLLAVNWPGQGTLQFLTLHETPVSYGIGFVAATLVSSATLWWAFRVLRKRTPRQLLAGEPTERLPPTARTIVRGHDYGSFALMVLSAVAATAALAATSKIKDHEALAGAFFGSGFLLLVSLLTLAWRRLTSPLTSDPQPGLVRVGCRNACRNPVRSLLTISLLAAATFLIVAVQAFHREPAEDFFDKQGGSGGFRLFAQTDLPVYQNLGDRAALSELGIDDAIIAKIADIQSLRLQPGDDASCLNLYQPLQPRLLGVPSSLIEQNRFAFIGAPSNRSVDSNPWMLLRKFDRIRGDVFDPSISSAAIVDANSAQWILKVGIGDKIPIKASPTGASVAVEALLKDSLFQSEILVSERDFLKLFPDQQGYQFFLIRCDAGDQAAVQKALATALASYGGKVRPTFDRLASYLAVENTYLATFQALGGLGLLLGAIGSAVVLVRGVWERRAEFALLRAVGFRGRQLATMVLAENGVLLLAGTVIGCVAAMVAVGPHLIGGDAKIVWGQITLLLVGVLTVGAAASALAVARSLRTPVLTALRRE